MKTITNEEAFRPVEGEIDIPINYAQHDFQFTRNWFRLRNERTWSTYLRPKFRGITTDWPIKMIQIGVFEGMDLCWCLQNILTHPDSRVIAIDPWAATTKLDAEYMEQVMMRAYHNLAPWKDKVHIVRGFSADVLAADLLLGGETRSPLLENQYEFAVIDGDHNAFPVCQDAELCYRLVKPGGWLVFDDVRNRVPKKDHVVDGIRMFLKGGYADKVKLVHQHRYVDIYEKL